MDISTYGWSFIAVYMALMIFLAYIGWKRTKTFAQFTTAPRSYGPLITSLVAVSTAASAVTYMGMPGMSYTFGYAMLWFPFTVFGAMALALAVAGRGVIRVAERLGSLSIPDYFGDRFNSKALRLIAAFFTLMTFWWVLGNFVAVGWLFNTLLGVSYQTGLLICLIITVGYVYVGGTYADILTDTAQSVIMIFVSIVTFVMGYLYLFPGGVEELNSKIIAQGAQLGWDNLTNPANPMVGSGWKIAMMWCALFFIGLTSTHAKYLLILKKEGQFRNFVILYFIFGSFMSLASFGGLGARAFLGGSGIVPDQALPMLYVKAFHPILGAFLAVALLAAIMSTVDGVFLTMSVSISNEIYRKTLAPIIHKTLSKDAIERKALFISKISLIVIGIAAWYFASPPPKFLVILVWLGFGVLIVAIAPSIVVSGFWKRITKAGAFSAMAVGLATYLILLKMRGFAGVFECIGIGTLAGLATAVIVSLFTKPLPEDLINKMFK